MSVAIHNEAELPRAEGADLALVSPLARPGSKVADLRPPLGADGFGRLASRLPCPAYALGGVTVKGLKALRPSGAAVLSQLWASEDPRADAERLLEALEGG